MTDEINTILKLLEAAFLGGLIGFERERNNQPAGLRTHIILCMGSALLMITSYKVAASGPPTADPGRIAAQVVTGIGFLGAGAILRMGLSVRGLTTAASIWTTAAIGLAVGAGFHVEAAAAVVIMLLSLVVLKGVSRKFAWRRRFKLVEIALQDHHEEDVIHEVEEILSRERLDVREIDVRKDPEAGTMSIRVQVTAPKDFDAPRLIETLTAHTRIIRAEVR